MRPLPYVFFVLAVLCLLSSRVPAQTCSGRIAGIVKDAHGTEEMAFANVYLVEQGRGVEADETGRFVIENQCPGPVTLRFSHIGCDPEEMKFTFRTDTVLEVYLHHHENYTQTVTITSTAGNVGYEERLDRQSDRQLSDVLEGINGLSSLRTGTAAAKPVFDGLFGNRLSIQNNGVAQAGQQWGNDHAPEIDPWVAAYVRVVEGVDALQYGGSTLGPTVLIEPAELGPRTKSGGKVAYGFRSNGLGHTLNARVTDSAFVAYRLSGSLKYAGDQRTPDYFLTNTGHREANLALQVAKYLNPRLTLRGYYSLFNAEIGVLRGSHIGNLSDLEEAIGRSEPFFTEDRFGYTIASPRQTVSHHLAKAELEYQLNEKDRFTLLYGGQLDDRKEFDVRRGDDDRAALKLVQITHNVQTTYQRTLPGRQRVEAGLQYERVDNQNQPGTGILPLIPDYNAQRAGAFATYRREVDALRYHLGLRFDHQFYEPITISRDLPRRILRYRHNFNAVGGAAGASHRISARIRTDLELTYRERAPQINELYSQGLHQGVSGIEEGDSSLVPERSAKLTGGVRFTAASGRLSIGVSAFYQRIAHYINLEPQPDFRLTLRGAFPVFRYRGIDAELYGAKLNLFGQLGDLEVDSRLAILRGYNRSDDQGLIYLPATNWRTSLQYPFPGEMVLNLAALVVEKQSNVVPEQDLLPPPPAYALFDIGLSKRLSLGTNTLDLALEVDNALNQVYRDYLDRQRYFADAPGRSINFRLSYSW
ncbi:iron complex outermembrane receptor protein [Lewinella aquimaris]|uniref:Iron complex outermembrane receptor protein n=1 Tax=Neolewinella aquimaris TaxID=1835722 RepID=A0A840E9A8_9BACT|nr:carboxypeptidase-like regulatory domain-containing protein [Neolewinella aquimaris]MBB4078389.1 iron complex outermembrane receptor protein [Neolewinella aquimaris]